MKIISEWQVVDHGIEHSQYFQGCGTSFTKYSHCQTGCGNNFAEAIEDCYKMIAQSENGNINFEQLESEVKAWLKKEFNKQNYPRLPKVSIKSEDIYYHVSIRYNLASELNNTL